jgi:formate-dependent phosphoribosylglycinamide formyltransferase (GAR transformylase)
VEQVVGDQEQISDLPRAIAAFSVAPDRGVLRIRAFRRIGHVCQPVNARLTGDSQASWRESADSARKFMDAQRIAVDAVVVLTGCDRDAVAAFIRRLYLAGVTDPKRLTFKGLQAMARG